MTKRQNGMTLIEILIILLVVSVGMAATAKFQGDLLQSGATTKARTQALSFVQSEIETLRMNHGVAAGGSQDDVAGSNTVYDVSWKVNPIAGLTDTDQYTATVVWDDNKSREQNVSLGTVLYADRMLGGGAAKDEIRAEAAKCVFLGCSGGNGPAVVIVSVEVVDNVNPDGSWGGIENPTNNTTYNSGNKDLNLSDSTSVTTDSDDKIHVGKNLNGGIDLQEGDNQLAIGKDMNGDISAGSGDDQVDLGKDANGDINLGEGDNKLLVGKDMNGNLDLGSGSDEVLITKDANKDYINLGGGNNYLDIGKDANVSITAGDGNDSVEIGKDANQGPIDLGDGYNYLKIGKTANVSIITGDQADYVWIDHDKNGQGATLGGGDDYLYIGHTNNSPVDMGAGDDFVCIKGDFYGVFEGGTGSDSIYMGHFSQAKWQSESWRHHYLSGFENIMFNDGVVQGDPAPFAAMDDGRCVKSRSSVTAPEYAKKYTITVSVEFEAGDEVTEAEIINLVPDSFMADNVLRLDADGKGSFTLYTDGLIPSGKTFEAKSEWSSDKPPKLKITVRLVDE